MYAVTVESSFCAAHYLPGHSKCGKVHGHNYKVEVEIRGTDLENGMLVDFADVKAQLNKFLNLLDHQCLNDWAPFAPGGAFAPPTAECLAECVYAMLAETFPGLSPYRVTVWETPTSRASYWQTSESLRC